MNKILYGHKSQLTTFVSLWRQKISIQRKNSDLRLPLPVFVLLHAYFCVILLKQSLPTDNINQLQQHSLGPVPEVPPSLMA